MKLKNIAWLLIIALCSIFAACKKVKEPPTELSKLPPATQTGANTFGCLVNGKAWVAQRNDCSIFCSPSFKIYYDGSNGGYLGIEALIIDIKNNIDERFDIVFDSSNLKLIHPIRISNPLTTSSFKNFIGVSNCSKYEHYSDSSVIHIGNVIMTRYDLPNGIFSGTFEFTLTKPGCETLNVTDGRFDKIL